MNFVNLKSNSALFYNKGPFINDVTLILTFSDPPPPYVTFHHINLYPLKKGSGESRVKYMAKYRYVFRVFSLVFL